MNNEKRCSAQPDNHFTSPLPLTLKHNFLRLSMNLYSLSMTNKKEQSDVKTTKSTFVFLNIFIN